MFDVCRLCGYHSGIHAEQCDSFYGRFQLFAGYEYMYAGSDLFKPGVFNILGTILGSILLAVISNGLTMVGASFFLKDIIQGAVLIFAVGFVAVIRHKR